MRASTPLVLKSEDFYDTIAPEYRSISKKRTDYLNAIDSLVVEYAKKQHPAAYLDVGCGDGRRTLKIAKALGLAEVLGVDESGGMLDQVSGIMTKQASAVDLTPHNKFDLVTALWNVFGHIPTAAYRGEALGKIAYSMRPGAKFYLDVNNRYNSRLYGHQIVKTNRAIDEQGGDAGDAQALYEVGGKVITTVGHIFRPDEIDELLEEIPGLSITKKMFVDYETGEIVESLYEGQIFYELTKV